MGATLTVDTRSRKPRRAAPQPRAAAQRITDLGALAQQLREQQAHAQALEKARHELTNDLAKLKTEYGQMI